MKEVDLPKPAGKLPRPFEKIFFGAFLIGCLVAVGLLFGGAKLAMLNEKLRLMSLITGKYIAGVSDTSE
jgi:hypothetical protein